MTRTHPTAPVCPCWLSWRNGLVFTILSLTRTTSWQRLPSSSSSNGWRQRNYVPPQEPWRAWWMRLRRRSRSSSRSSRRQGMRCAGYMAVPSAARDRWTLVRGQGWIWVSPIRGAMNTPGRLTVTRSRLTSTTRGWTLSPTVSWMPIRR